MLHHYSAQVVSFVLNTLDDRGNNACMKLLLRFIVDFSLLSSGSSCVAHLLDLASSIDLLRGIAWDVEAPAIVAARPLISR